MVFVAMATMLPDKSSLVQRDLKLESCSELYQLVTRGQR